MKILNLIAISLLIFLQIKLSISQAKSDVKISQNANSSVETNSSKSSGLSINDGLLNKAVLDLTGKQSGDANQSATALESGGLEVAKKSIIDTDLDEITAVKNEDVLGVDKAVDKKLELDKQVLKLGKDASLNGAGELTKEVNLDGNGDGGLSKTGKLDKELNVEDLIGLAGEERGDEEEEEDEDEDLGLDIAKDLDVAKDLEKSIDIDKESDLLDLEEVDKTVDLLDEEGKTVKKSKIAIDDAILSTEGEEEELANEKKSKKSSKSKKKSKKDKKAKRKEKIVCQAEIEFDADQPIFVDDFEKYFD